LATALMQASPETRVARAFLPNSGMAARRDWTSPWSPCCAFARRAAFSGFALDQAAKVCRQAACAAACWALRALKKARVSGET
jgi:hypothetical protein